MNIAPASLRIGLIARNTFVEAVRQRLFVALLLVCLAFVATVPFLGEFNFGESEMRFIVDFGFGVLLFFGSILAIVATAQSFFSELDQRTALTLLAKPVGRSDFVLGKWLGMLGILALFALVTTLLLLVVLLIRDGAGGAPDGSPGARGGELRVTEVWIYALLQWLKFGILAGMTLTIAGYARSMQYTVTMVFFAFVICQLQYVARAAYADIGFLPGRWILGAILLLFPDFQVFNVGDSLVLGRAGEGAVLAQVALYGFLYNGVFAAAAILSFRVRK